MTERVRVGWRCVNAQITAHFWIYDQTDFLYHALCGALADAQLVQDPNDIFVCKLCKHIYKSLTDRFPDAQLLEKAY